MRISEVEPITIKYVDDEQDEVVLLTDADLRDCMLLCRQQNWAKIELKVGVSERLRAQRSRDKAPQPSVAVPHASPRRSDSRLLSPRSGGSGSGSSRHTPPSIWDHLPRTVEELTDPHKMALPVAFLMMLSSVVLLMRSSRQTYHT